MSLYILNARSNQIIPIDTLSTESNAPQFANHGSIALECFMTSQSPLWPRPPSTQKQACPNLALIPWFFICQLCPARPEADEMILLSAHPRRVHPRQSNRPSEYHFFEGAMKAVHDGAIQSLALQVLWNIDKNGGRCRRGVLKRLLESAGSSIGFLQITWDA